MSLKSALGSAMLKRPRRITIYRRTVFAQREEEVLSILVCYNVLMDLKTGSLSTEDDHRAVEAVHARIAGWTEADNFLEKTGTETESNIPAKSLPTSSQNSAPRLSTDSTETATSLDSEEERMDASTMKE